MNDAYDPMMATGQTTGSFDADPSAHADLLTKLPNCVLSSLLRVLVSASNPGQVMKLSVVSE